MSDSDFRFDQENGIRVHWWRNPTGDDWACAARDHGPFCRLCQPVEDDTTRACLEAAREGGMEVRVRPDGELVFKLTQKGHARVEELLQTNPAMIALWCRLQALESS